MPLPYPVIMFDLDGTLTDPKLGITSSVQYALARFGIDVSDLDSLTPFIGPPLIESFERFYGLSYDQAIEAVSFYREYFGPIGLKQNQLYEGIPELLAELRAGGASLAIASSKATVFVEQIAEHFRIAGYFDIMVGSNLDHTRVAKHEVIAHLRSSHAAFSAENVVMIGDREHDILGAAAHAVPGIGVSYGYGSRDELQAAGALAIADSVADLAVLLGVA